MTFIRLRLNGRDGFGAIFPAMANAVMAFDALGYAETHPDRSMARAAIERLLVENDEEAYCQPCKSPVWDTALACHALMETGSEEAARCAARGLDWLKPLQMLDTVGDWAVRRKDVKPGGWAFQYANPHYPDLDDTAVVVMAMDRAAVPRFDHAVARGRAWVAGLQSHNGGWGAYDADNVYEYLNNIPFADHGALLDPPTADVTARCLSMLAQLGGTAANRSRHRQGRRVSAPPPASRRQLVWPLGHELHIRNLVGVVRARRNRYGSVGAGNSQRRRLPDIDPERRRRLGRRQCELQA